MIKARRAKTSSIQLTAFGLGLMALLLLAVVRVDLLNTWQDRLPEGTPNHFIINIQEADLQRFETHTSTLSNPFYPMAVGRFIAINHEPLLAENYTNNRAKSFIARTFNLSSATTLPAGKFRCRIYHTGHTGRQFSGDIRHVFYITTATFCDFTKRGIVGVNDLCDLLR